MSISFVYPGFLYALAFIAIPVIIHLFNFRRFRKIYFTNVSFLKELKEETTSRSRLKHLLVLCSRILAVVFLVLAFAQPYIPSEEGHKISADRAVSLYIDNSFSMEAITREGTLLDQAKTRAAEIAKAFKPSDRFQVLTNDFDPVHQRLLSREEFLNAVTQIKVSPVTRTAREILSRQTDALNQSGAPDKRVVLISDFQQSMLSADDLKPDSSLVVTLVPLNAGSVANLSVDSCWFSSPVVQLGQTTELNVRIRNHGDQDAEAVPVKLSVGGTQKSVAGATVASGNYSDVLLTFTASSPGWQKAVVSITDNPVTFDDQYYFSFHVADHAELLAIYQDRPGPFLKALFPDSGYFRVTYSDIKQTDYGSFASRNAIILDELSEISTGLSSEITRYIRNGGTVIVVPDSSPDLASYGRFLSGMGVAPFTSLVMNAERVEKLMLEDPVFDGVFSSAQPREASMDLPSVKGYFHQSSGSAETLMQLRSGAPLLSRFRAGKGEVYLFAVPFSGELSNLSRHAVFVPVMYRMALLSGKPAKPALFIGKDDQIELPFLSITGDQVFHLVNKGQNFDIIPAHRPSGTGTMVSINNQVTLAGNYELVSSGQIVAAPSYNFNRDESVMSFFDAEALSSLIAKQEYTNVSLIEPGDATLTAGFSLMNEGFKLWKYCIMLALLFLAIEILLLKYLK